MPLIMPNSGFSNTVRKMETLGEENDILKTSLSPNMSSTSKTTLWTIARLNFMTYLSNVNLIAVPDNGSPFSFRLSINLSEQIIYAFNKPIKRKTVILSKTKNLSILSEPAVQNLRSHMDSKSYINHDRPRSTTLSDSLTH